MSARSRSRGRTTLVVLRAVIGAGPRALSAVARWVLRLGLPLAGMAAMLALFPCRVTAAGADFRVQGSVLLHRGLSAETTFGSWSFPHLDGLPVGVHISPVNIDLVRLAAKVSPNPQRYAERLRADLVDQLPHIAVWIIGEALIGVLLGMALAAAINLALRQLRALPHRRHEVRYRLHQLLGGAIVVVLLVQVGVASYNPGWARRSQVSGTLAALQLFPNRLQQYYEKHSKAVDVLNAVSAIQSNLQQRITRTNVPPAAFTILFISDMHLATTYPLVAQYAKSFHVSLIINTGDESEFGTTLEMTPSYLRQMRQLTAVAPMIWLAGNHDSPATVRVMRTVKGVTVLGTKVSDHHGGSVVAAQLMSAYGLSIGAVPDPRIYGGTGDFGSNDPTVVHALEAHAVDSALAGVPEDEQFDIFATHEPVAAEQILADLPGQVRQVNSGHLHAQNSDADLQHGSVISLVEGSTGAGGLDALDNGVPPPPVEFSIESVAADCQFTKVVRFQIKGAAPGSTSEVTSGKPPQVTASTHYFTAQHVAPGRTCDVSQGMSPVGDLTASDRPPASPPSPG